MPAQYIYLISSGIRRIAAFIVIGLSLAMGSAGAQAVVINFDDLTYVPSNGEFDCFCDHPLTDEYLAKGLRIDDGFLGTYGSSDLPFIVSQPNYLLGGNSLLLSFVGALPTSVSMYVSAGMQDAVFLRASGPENFSLLKQTSGWNGPLDDTPYVPKQFVSFESSTGIGAITLESYYGSRVGAIVDDLRYDYASVPEPASIMLLGLGLFGFMLRRRS